VPVEDYSRTVSSIFPIRSRVQRSSSSESLVAEITDKEADEVFSALSSSTARTILGALYEEPQTASGLSNHAEISVQNAKYHIDNLLESGLIEVVDTWYSESGQPMKVYAPKNHSIVVFASIDTTKSYIKETIKQLVGGLAFLSIGGILIDEYVKRAGSTSPSEQDLVGNGSSATAFETLSPGMMFVFAGVFLLTLYLCYKFYESRGCR
jgi:DNA-binding transcriptional ArsR family regulator